MSDEQLAIWWTSSEDMSVLGEVHEYASDKAFWDADGISIGVNDTGIFWLDNTQLPVYLKRQLQSRSGRSGRGRLWVDEQFDLEEIPWPDNNLLAKKADLCAGIVIRREDVEAVKHFPGFVTTLEFEPL